MIRSATTVALLLALACRGNRQRATGSSDSSPQAPAPSTQSDARPAIVFLGTSLTAGYGLGDPRLAYPALIQAKLDSAGRPYRVVNAGLSGESSAGALDRIEWLLSRDRVAVLVVETGANDGLRAQDVAATRENIEAIIERAQRATPPPQVVLVGMQAPANYGADYARRFRALYPELAARHHLPLVPFLLEGVAGVAALNQADGIHPTPEGHRLMAETVWKVLGPLLRADAARRPGG